MWLMCMGMRSRCFDFEVPGPNMIL
uniref:Uncharacterized protein n=1 Tax=Triticum urartu TaxID=4572 RepID=A0A8R7P0U3_TRIUA